MALGGNCHPAAQMTSDSGMALAPLGSTDTKAAETLPCGAGPPLATRTLGFESVSSQLWLLGTVQPDLASLLPAQEHQAFYSSALHMVNQPCRLQHLASLAVCTRLGDHCHEATALLPLPPVLWDYLLLSVEGHIE